MTGLRRAAQAAAALVVSVGVGRFVYTPILPLLTGQAGLTAEAGASVATANYHMTMGAVVCVEAEPEHADNVEAILFDTCAPKRRTALSPGSCSARTPGSSAFR
jgi:hypothetical protein